MALIIGKIKCCFCNKKHGFFHSVHKYGIYGYELRGRIFYHDECLQMVEIDPEKYGHRMADMAINIHELKKRNQRHNKKYKRDFEKRAAELQKKHFERMMPKE